jgi:hypothetical protein
MPESSKWNLTRKECTSQVDLVRARPFLDVDERTWSSWRKVSTERQAFV